MQAEALQEKLRLPLTYDFERHVADAVAALCPASALAAGYMVLRGRDVVEITDPSDRPPAQASPSVESTDVPATGAPGESVPPLDTAVASTFPPADPTAKNFLITGADNGACADADSPFAPTFGDAESGRVGKKTRRGRGH